jgi:hypothetical protein
LIDEGLRSFLLCVSSVSINDGGRVFLIRNN